MEGLRGFARHCVVDGDRAALLDHLAGGIETNDPREAGAVEVLLGGSDVLLERRRAGVDVRCDGHGSLLRVPKTGACWYLQLTRFGAAWSTRGWRPYPSTRWGRPPG